LQVVKLKDSTDALSSDNLQQLSINPDTTQNKPNEPIFTTVESEPMFPGGTEELYRFLAKTLRYPETMRNNNIQGKVFVTFIIEKDGSLSNIKSVRDVGYGSAEEAIRTLKLSPKWKPGYQNGHAVRVQYTMPITFALETSKPPKSSSMYNDTGKYSGNRFGLNPIYNYPNDSLKTYGIKGFSVTAPPLCLLDGKEITILSSVNPNDIESINVLKPKPGDSNLQLLYGEKAVNGVILIKTKKTKPAPAH
jgi:TonB family protein